jgi:hypothetical protein
MRALITPGRAIEQEATLAVQTHRHPHWDPKYYFRSTLVESVKADAYQAVFDPRFGGMWVKEPIDLEGEHSQPRNSVASPKSDGSGVWWTVPGYWTIEALTHQAACDEVDRLCACAGYSPADAKWARGMLRLRKN